MARASQGARPNLPCLLLIIGQDGKLYNRWAAYGQSKTANILFTQELVARGILSYAVHPGAIWGTTLSADVDRNTAGEEQRVVPGQYGGELLGGLTPEYHV